jgi:hypothetical protein
MPPLHLLFEENDNFLVQSNQFEGVTIAQLPRYLRVNNLTVDTVTVSDIHFLFALKSRIYCDKLIYAANMTGLCSEVFDMATAYLFHERRKIHSNTVELQLPQEGLSNKEVDILVAHIENKEQTLE